MEDYQVILFGITENRDSGYTRRKKVKIISGNRIKTSVTNIKDWCMGREICDRFGVLSYRQKNTQITELGIDSSLTLFLLIMKII